MICLRRQRCHIFSLSLTGDHIISNSLQNRGASRSTNYEEKNCDLSKRQILQYFETAKVAFNTIGKDWLFER